MKRKRRSRYSKFGTSTKKKQMLPERVYREVTAKGFLPRDEKGRPVA